MARLTQLSPHSVLPLGHRHSPSRHFCAAGQATSQAPQCSSSIARLTQLSPHRTLLGLHCPANLLWLSVEAAFAAEVESDSSEPGGSDEQPSTSPVIAS